VAGETACVIAVVRNEIPIYTGIDADIPTGPGERKMHPDDVEAAARGVLGAPLKVSFYLEMRLANLTAAGQVRRPPLL